MYGKIIQRELKIGENKFEAPKGTKLLGVHVDKLSGKPILFALSDLNQGKTKEIKVSTYCTNSDAEIRDGKYIATYQLPMNGKFYHVFQDK